MKTKSSKPIKSKIDKNKIVSDFYLDYTDFKQKPVSLNFISKLVEDFLEYIQLPDVYNCMEFFLDRGIAWITVKRWRERYPEFEDAYQYAKGYLGIKREKQMLQRKINDKVGMFMQGRYDPEWRERELELAKEAGSNEGKEYIVLKNLGSSDLVPKKEEE